MIEIEDMHVKEIVKITKKKDDGIITQHKAILESVGERDIKIVITSDMPFDLVQGEKGLKISINSTQTILGNTKEKN